MSDEDGITIRDMRVGAFVPQPPPEGVESSEVITEVIEVPTEEPKPFVCETCGRSFESTNALGVHKRVHEDKVKCPDCGKMYQPGPGMAAHRKSKHGGAPVGKKICPDCLKPVATKDMARHRRRMHGEKVEEISAPPKRIPRRQEWEVDDIFNTVVQLMWPSGNVPVNAFLPLIHWREATAKMLVEVAE